MDSSKSLVPENLRFKDFPNETITEILLQVTDLETLANLCQTNQRIREICQTEHFWKMKYQRDFPPAEKIRSVGYNKVVSWKEKYKLAYSIPNSPISAGDIHFAIIDDQNILHMGGNYEHKRDFNNETDFGKLSKIPPLRQKVQSVSCASSFTGAVTEDGKVYFWGLELGSLFGDENYRTVEPREFKIPGRAIKITCSYTDGPDSEFVMFAVILEDGSVYLRMNYIFDNPDSCFIDETIVEITTILKISTGNLKAIDISANGEGLAIISTDGKLYYLGKGLGSKYNDTVGIINEGDQIIVNPLHIPLPETIKQVSLGSDHIGVISSKGNIYLWGHDYHGQLGMSLTPETKYTYKKFIDSPRKLPFHVLFSTISCQNASTVAIDENGALYGWGSRYDLFEPLSPSDLTDKIVPPIKIGLELIGNDTIIKDTFNYIDIGFKVSISTTRDGVVNVWY